jgi:uncharacterized membrane protein
MAALIFAPGFGGGLAEFSLDTPFFVSAGMCVVGFILGYFYITEPNVDKKKEAPAAVTSTELSTNLNEIEIGDLTSASERAIADEDAAQYQRNLPYVRWIWLCSFLMNLGFRLFITVMAIWVNYKFNWASKEFGFMASAVGVLGIGSNLVLFGKMVGQYGDIKTCLIAMFLSTIFWVLTAFSQTTNGPDATGTIWTGPILFIFATAARTCFNAITSTSVKTLLAKYATKNTQGSTMGKSESFNAVGGVIGPLLAGYIYDLDGQDYIPLVSAGCYFLAFLCILVVYLKDQGEGESKKDEDAEKEHLLADEFETAKSEICFLKNRVMELEMENQTLRKGGAECDENDKVVSQGVHRRPGLGSVDMGLSVQHLAL